MSIAPIQNASRPVAHPASEPQPGGEGGFAQLMALQAPADEPPQAVRPDEVRQARSRQPARTAVQGPKADAPRDTPDVAKPPRETAEASDPAEGNASPLDPALAQWLQTLHRPDMPAEVPGGGAQVTAEPGAARKPPGLPLARLAAQPAEGSDAPVAPGTRAGHGTHASRGADKDSRETPLATAQALAARSSDDTPAAAAPVPNEPPPAASAGGFALPAGFEPVSATAPDISAPLAAESPVPAVPVPVPVESPEFAQAFGLEISVLARDGVQQAELHLNPAEMGPVTVQIALDGEKARVDFGAQAAATRAAIEASLPELAAALRDAGLTLAGGGVSQQTGQRGDHRRDGEAGSARPGMRDRADAVAAAPSRPALRSRAGPGGVDLYA